MSTTTLKDGPRPETVSRRTEALVAGIAQHHKAISAHQSRLLATVAELDRRKAWRVDGATSMVSWLVQRCAVTAATARDWVTAAEKLQKLPEIANALSQGKLSFDQVKPLAEVATPETDTELAEKATNWSAKQVRDLASASRNQSNQEAAGVYSRRFLRFNDRRFSISGSFAGDQYTKIKSALITGAGRLEGKRDTRTFDQRLADSLAELCEQGLLGRVGQEYVVGGDADGGVDDDDGGDDGGEAGGEAVGGDPGASGDSATNGAGRNGRKSGGRIRPTVVVHADLEFLAGGAGYAELDVLGPLAREVARRLACDAKIVLSADDAEGRSIQQGGARRSPTTAQRLEIRRRDKGCRFPGCTYSEFTDVHHVVHWTNGGPTDIPNLVTLCDQHHRAVHEMGWKMSGDTNVLLSFKSPTGRFTSSTPSPTFRPARAGPPG
jgi:hypothetical protein